MASSTPSGARLEKIAAHRIGAPASPLAPADPCLRHFEVGDRQQRSHDRLLGERVDEVRVEHRDLVDFAGREISPMQNFAIALVSRKRGRSFSSKSASMFALRAGEELRALAADGDEIASSPRRTAPTSRNRFVFSAPQSPLSVLTTITSSFFTSRTSSSGCEIVIDALAAAKRARCSAARA